MARDAAEVRGRALVRPFRVAQLVDSNSPEEIRNAIGNLTLAWGGIYTPIIDANLPFDAIELQARLFDVDALHLEAEQGELLEQLRRADWLWRGRGRSGPFAAPEEGLRTGVLPTSALTLDHPALYLPEWDAQDPLDLFYTAVFGTPSRTTPEPETGEDTWEPAGSLRAGLGTVVALPNVTVDDVGMIQTTRVGISPAVRHDLEWMNGLYVVRRESTQDVLSFWNMRAFGRPVLPLPDDGPEDLLTFLTRGTLRGGTTQYGGPNPRTEKYLGVWGLANASERTQVAIDTMAERLGMVVRDHHPVRERRSMFPGLDTRFKASVRAEFPSTARSVMVRVPRVPLDPEVHQVMPGTVAVEIDVHDVPGLDPRLTPSLPPLRRFGRLLERSGMGLSSQVRINSGGDGIVLGVPATTDEVPIGFAYHLDAIGTLFDNEELKLSQSDDGRFQTRAAEMLGGTFGGVMVQPGVRALIDKAGRSSAGLTLQQLRAEVKNHRGAWPDKLTTFRTTADEYSERTVNSLLFSGLFVPMLDVHCSNCRVDSQVSPRDLDSSVQCEFCGGTFRLALSLALSKSRWRYRLASHLGPDKVKALLPALATSSLLAQLTTQLGAAGPHAFGVEFKFSGNRRMEADIVSYLARPDWAVVLAEVKSGNRIDQNDVQNLEDLQGQLDQAKVRSVLTFASLKDRLANEEIHALRALVERGRLVTTASGAVVPRLPLILTSRELSLPWDHDEHPNRWGQPGAGDGIFTTAIESCRRNLGLVAVEPTASDYDQTLSCAWQSVPDLSWVTD